VRTSAGRTSTYSRSRWSTSPDSGCSSKGRPIVVSRVQRNVATKLNDHQCPVACTN
jgi:hypothetical protein